MWHLEPSCNRSQLVGTANELQDPTITQQSITSTMKTNMISKLVICLAVLSFSLPSFAQNLTYGIVKGKVTKFQTDLPYPKVNISVFTAYGDTIITTSDINGEYELNVPVGIHTLEASSIYSLAARMIKIYEEKTTEQDIFLPRMGTEPTWESSVPYAELNGQWSSISYTNNGQTINLKPEATIFFSFSDYELPGQIGWSNGCNGCGTTFFNKRKSGQLYFRHTGDGNIEVHEEGTPFCSLLYCPGIPDILGKFVNNMKGKKTKSVISQNGQQLELYLENEKFVFRKIHDNTNKQGPDLSGKWKPIEGKLNGKKITFGKEAEVIISKWTGIHYKDGIACNNDNRPLRYGYNDEDYITLSFQSVRTRPEACKEFLLDDLFKQLYGGCSVKFYESSQTVILESGDTMLFMRRIATQWKQKR